jgi:hypothetical protein
MWLRGACTRGPGRQWACGRMSAPFRLLVVPVNGAAERSGRLRVEAGVSRAVVPGGIPAAGAPRESESSPWITRPVPCYLTLLTASGDGTPVALCSSRPGSACPRRARRQCRGQPLGGALSLPAGPDPERHVGTVNASPAELVVTAPNGVQWKRLPGGTSSAGEFLAVLASLRGGRVARNWNLWQEGRAQREDGRQREVLFQWERAGPPPGPRPPDEEVKAEFEARYSEALRRRGALAAAYDRGRAIARLNLLSAQAGAGFMRHVLENPASGSQRDKATEFLAAAEQEIKALEPRVGDPDAVPDERGDLPPARRRHNLVSHMVLFRHEALRAWSTEQRHRFRVLLAMPAPEPADMCSECQAPARWHDYAVSLRLSRPETEGGPQAETTAGLGPGWRKRCPASADTQIRQGLPDFDGDQWQAMLPPLLRAVFVPGPSPQREVPGQRAVAGRRLRGAEAEASRIQRETDGPDPGGS